MRHTQRLLLHACCVVAAIALLHAGGCLVSGNRCDEHQIEDTSDSHHACVCEPGYVMSSKGYGCDPCGAHEEVVGDKCVCKEGYSRSSESAPCKAFEGTRPGTACGAGEPACMDPNPYCAETEDEPYCTTQGCERNDDCPADWRCSKMGEESFCRKPPASYTKSCQSNADCDAEAAYCESLQAHVCIINDCLQAPDKCLSQSVCCDLTGLIGQSLCVPTSSLSNGKCVGGADPVRP